MARKTVFVGVPVLASVCHLACKSKSNNHFVFQDQDRFSNMAVHKGRICFILEDKSSSLLCYFRFFLDPFLTHIKIWRFSTIVQNDLPSSTPMTRPQLSQNSAYKWSKHPTQKGLPSLIMYRWPPSGLEHSAQAKCPKCQCLPSASVHSSDKMSYRICIKLSLFWHVVTRFSPRRRPSIWVWGTRRDVAHKRGGHLHRSKWGRPAIRSRHCSRNNGDATICRDRRELRWREDRWLFRSTIKLS